VSVRPESRSSEYFKDRVEIMDSKAAAEWLDRDVPNMAGKLLSLPTRKEIDVDIKEQLIVEFYSR
jgi:small subunit ribosomal protein S4